MHFNWDFTPTLLHIKRLFTPTLLIDPRVVGAVGLHQTYYYFAPDPIHFAAFDKI